MTVPHDEDASQIHQIVFRWAGNRSGAGAGITAVAQSCGERDAREMAEQLGPILRVRGGDQRSIVRVIWNDRAVLVRRRPKADAQGRGSTVCHALLSPPRFLTASFCLGLGASPWGDDNWTQASGTLNRIPYDRLDAMANHAIPKLDAAVPSLVRPLECLVAQLLRTPSGRVSALTRGLETIGTGSSGADSDEVPDAALVALRGLCEVFGRTLGGEGWTYASYATVDSHPLRVTFVPSWRASHEEDVRLRRIDLTDPGSDRAAELAQGLVRHYLDHIGSGGATADGAREKYERPLERLRGPLAETEDDEERYEAVDRALRGLPPRDRAARPQRGTNAAPAQGEGRGDGPSGRSTARATQSGQYDDEQGYGYERDRGGRQAARTASVPPRSGARQGGHPSAGAQGRSGSGDHWTTGTEGSTGGRAGAGSVGRSATGTEGSTGGRSGSGTDSLRTGSGQSDDSGDVRSHSAAATGGNGTNGVGAPSSGMPSSGARSRAEGVSTPAEAVPDVGSQSGALPGSPGWTADSLVHGSAPTHQPTGSDEPPEGPQSQQRQQSQQGHENQHGHQGQRGHQGFTFEGAPDRGTRPPSHGEVREPAPGQYAPDPPPVPSSLPAPPSGFDLAPKTEPVKTALSLDRSIPPQPKSPPAQHAPQPSQQSQFYYIDPDHLLGLSNPFPRKRKCKLRQAATPQQLRELRHNLAYATAADRPGEDLKVNTQRVLESFSDGDLLAVVVDRVPLSYEAQNLVLHTLFSIPRTEEGTEALCVLLLEWRFLLMIPPPADEQLESRHTRRLTEVACWLFRTLQKPLAGEALRVGVGQFLRQLASSRDPLPREFLNKLLFDPAPDEVPVLHNLVWRDLALGLHERSSLPSGGASG
ncbi:hypothetical protein ABZ348_10020 [Streptomyces sp. NPDC005963]|uniref:hypothetical protein n=1 Tax=Streptomyces sp. NPDC005963 TaxID=3156721 RepID=UPI0033DABAA6